MFRAALFLVPASALWALLPLVASRRLGLGSSGYGLLLGALGAGAIAGVSVLSKVRARLSANAIIGLAGGVFSAALARDPVRSTVVVVIVLIPAGMAWVGMLATVNTLLQLFLPRWVRARGLSVYQMVLFGAQGLGAVAWGVVADSFGLTLTFLVAAGLMAVGYGFDPHLAARRHLPHGPQHGGSARPACRARAGGGHRTGRGAHDLFDPGRARA